MHHTQGAAQLARGARGFLETSPDSTTHLLMYKMLGGAEAKIHTPTLQSPGEHGDIHSCE